MWGSRALIHELMDTILEHARNWTQHREEHRCNAAVAERMSKKLEGLETDRMRMASEIDKNYAAIYKLQARLDEQQSHVAKQKGEDVG